jgi:hypothetical protein
LQERPRVDTAIPGELGIHGALPAEVGEEELPAYVPREFDFRLRTALASNLPRRGRFVIMVGNSSVGKTRSLYEAVFELAPDWWLVQPAEVAELLAYRNDPPRDTVFWLDELHQYLGGHPALTSECVRALVRNGNLLVGTLWPDQYTRWTAGRDDVHQLVKSATMIAVSDAMTEEERAEAEKVGRRDRRVRDALRPQEAGMTQVLAGGPRLVMSWDAPANAFVRPMITAAVDAHRLGVQSPLSEDLLADAMYDHVKPWDRVRPQSHWLSQALPQLTEPLFGDVRPLYPMDDGRAGTQAGYVIADYLAQHVRRRRRSERIPHSSWQALVDRLSRADDLRRLADAATARLRYHYAEGALTRLVREFGDGHATMELADLCIKQDRLIEAERVLRERVADHPDDWAAEKKLKELRELRTRVDRLRPTAGRRARQMPAEIAELLYDGGLSADLREEAAAGNASSADRLADLLFERGNLRELRQRAERGEPRSAEALADLYAGWGEHDLLRARAEAGDRAAELRLSKLQRAAGRGAGAGPAYEIEALRRAVDEGDYEAPGKLCSLLFDLRDEDNLRAELEAGTAGAADRLLALYTARDDPSLIRLRAFGLDADGKPFNP